MLGINDVETALSSDENKSLACLDDGTLVVGTWLQTVASIETKHHEGVGTIFLGLYDDTRDTMVGDNPHDMVTVLQDAADAGAVKSLRHIEQLDMVGLTVIDIGSRGRSLPNQFTTILQDTGGGMGQGGQIGILRYSAVDELTSAGIDDGIVIIVGNENPATMGPGDGGHVAIGQC